MDKNQTNILICGCGALGSNLTALLAADLHDKAEITVLDKDDVEKRNVQAGTQFYMPDQTGLPKVEALQFNIYNWYQKKINIIEETYPGHKGWQEEQFLSIDCFDNFDGRSAMQMVWESFNKVDKKTHHLLHVGFSDTMSYEICWAEDYEVPDNEPQVDICELPGAASFIKFVSSLASQTIQDFLATGNKRDFIGNKFVVREII